MPKLCLRHIFWVTVLVLKIGEYGRSYLASLYKVFRLLPSRKRLNWQKGNFHDLDCKFAIIFNEKIDFFEPSMHKNVEKHNLTFKSQKNTQPKKNLLC